MKSPEDQRQRPARPPTMLVWSGPGDPPDDWFDVESFEALLVGGPSAGSVTMERFGGKGPWLFSIYLDGKMCAIYRPLPVRGEVQPNYVFEGIIPISEMNLMKPPGQQ